MKCKGNNLDEFLKLNLKLIIEPIYDEEYDEEAITISSPDMPGVKVFGETLEEALEELQEAKIAWFEMKEQRGEVINMDKKAYIKKPSGRMTVRFPITLHSKLINYAEEEKTSINSAIIQLLNEGLENNFHEKVLQRLKGIETAIDNKTPIISFINNSADHPYSNTYAPHSISNGKQRSGGWEDTGILFDTSYKGLRH